MNAVSSSPPALRASTTGAGWVVTPDALKVLVVEDDEMMHRLVGRALAGLGFSQVLAAADGAAGLGTALSERPDIIISDYRMPGMHGLDMVEAIRRDPALDGTVIIMLSAADDQEVIKGARDVGADTFIVKPFARADLKRLIDTLYARFNCGRIAWPA
jgi:two-component system, chemotaxis family, chemotaxis protein CheY